MQYISCVPAYGKDYTSAKDVKAAFAADKDFLIVDVHHPDYGRYVNRQDIAGQAVTLSIRYKRRTEVCLCKA